MQGSRAMKGIETSIVRLSFIAAVACAATGCAATSTNNAGAGANNIPAPSDSAASIQDYVLVDCLLPGQIRRLGTSMTYLTPRRTVKATERDCAIRGGEYVLFDRSDYGSALATLLPKARSGDPVAQTYVGEIYEKGLGLPGPDYAAAASWYRKAADQDHGPAQTSLGSLYERGLGVPKDKVAALEWYRRATGLTEDRLIFESALKAEREAFQREIALRNRVASSLRQQLHQAKQQQTSASTGASPRAQELQRVKESQLRETQREAELRQKTLHAVETIRASDGGGQGADAGKAAQAGKLELSLRQQINGLQDTSRRLAAAQ
jgi:hypothetical protein